MYKVYISRMDKDFVEIVYGELGMCGGCFHGNRFRVSRGDYGIYKLDFVPTGAFLPAYDEIGNAKIGDPLPCVEVYLRRLRLI